MSASTFPARDGFGQRAAFLLEAFDRFLLLGVYRRERRVHLRCNLVDLRLARLQAANLLRKRRSALREAFKLLRERLDRTVIARLGRDFLLGLLLLFSQLRVFETLVLQLPLDVCAQRGDLLAFFLDLRALAARFRNLRALRQRIELLLHLTNLQVNLLQHQKRLDVLDGKRHALLLTEFLFCPCRTGLLGEISPWPAMQGKELSPLPQSHVQADYSASQPLFARKSAFTCELPQDATNCRSARTP